MTAAQVAALCVSLTAGKTKAEIMAAAVKSALADYRAKHGGAKL